jgi:NAD(P)-dependent dehydrogenase (short-subunit alcohol dehydrogenase family)
MARTAIITGAAQGIGEAIALQLAKDGCNVVLNDLASKQAELQALVDNINAASTNPKTLMATYVLGDVSVEDDVKAMVEVAVATFGALDIVRLLAVLTRMLIQIPQSPQSEDDCQCRCGSVQVYDRR